MLLAEVAGANAELRELVHDLTEDIDNSQKRIRILGSQIAVLVHEKRRGITLGDLREFVASQPRASFGSWLFGRRGN